MTAAAKKSKVKFVDPRKIYSALRVAAQWQRLARNDEVMCEGVSLADAAKRIRNAAVRV